MSKAEGTGGNMQINNNVAAFAFEQMDIADMFLPQRNLWRAG